MDYKLFMFLSLQITVLPLLVVSIIGWFIARRRSELGKRAILAQRGFGLLVAAELVMVYSTYLMSYGHDPSNAAEMAKDVGRLGLLRTTLATGGLATLIAAMFHRTPSGETAAPISQAAS
jgi:ABC-type sulfate transport system permease component